MPELPEVETIKLGLIEHLVGCKIENVQVRIPKMFIGSAKQIIGAKIVGLKRIGKGLIIELDNDFVLAVHLKMTGQLVYRDNKIKSLLSAKVGGETLPSKYTHVIFKLKTPACTCLPESVGMAGRQSSKLKTITQNSKLQDGSGAYLYYNDLRRFGWLRVVKKDELMQIPFFKEMGPEPLNNLTIEQFSNIVSQSNLAIKVLLMDQKRIGGIGNIYANDALFDSRIHPERKAKGLKSEEIKTLYDSILKVLKEALDYGGSSDENFVNALGQEGNYQNHALVYGREGEKCRVCDSEIKKIKLGGRGTYFCPNCQG